METKRCPYCGEEILAAAKKCKHCGEWLDSADVVCSQKSKVPCPICGEEIDEGTQVCPHCNEKTGASEMLRVIKTDAGSCSGEKSSGSQGPRANGIFKTYVWDMLTRHYADFKGKSGRKEFWMSYFLYSILWFVLYVSTMGISVWFGLIFSTLFFLATMLPIICLTVRRLHDIGKSGWWYFISAVPLVGTIWLLILLCKGGESSSPKVRWILSDTIVTAILGILLVAGILCISTGGDGSASMSNGGGNVRTGTNGKEYYLFDDTEWLPNADNTLWLCIATDDKQDVLWAREGYVDRNGNMTIISAETPKSSTVMPLLSASQIAAKAKAAGASEGYYGMYLNFIPSSIVSDMFYFDYHYDGQEFGKCGYYDMETGEFAIIGEGDANELLQLEE